MRDKHTRGFKNASNGVWKCAIPYEIYGQKSKEDMPLLICLILALKCVILGVQNTIVRARKASSLNLNTKDNKTTYLFSESYTCLPEDCKQLSFLLMLWNCPMRLPRPTPAFQLVQMTQCQQLSNRWGHTGRKVRWFSSPASPSLPHLCRRRLQPPCNLWIVVSSEPLFRGSQEGAKTWILTQEPSLDWN